ncbi:MAG TPA: hypothetical protein DCG75_11665 [Bacteroidales bacterium]|nr:hypothetical protein [Bacteroidales bacterium]
MATLKNGILGGVAGKIGNVVGSSWKGIDYLKTLPTHYTDAKTEVQITNRSKFLTLIRFLQTITDFIRVGYKSLAVKKSAFNAATSYLYHNAMTGDYPNISIDFTKVFVSRGNLTGAYGASVSSPTAGNIELRWGDNSADGTARADDVAMVVAYHSDLAEAYYTLNAANRSAGQASIQLPLSFSGGNVRVYLSFMAINALGSQAMKSVSNSVYVGEVQVT